MWLETSNQIAANNSYAVQLFIRDIDYSLQMIWIGQEVLSMARMKFGSGASQGSKPSAWETFEYTPMEIFT